jgi:hypothetical protein
MKPTLSLYLLKALFLIFASPVIMLLFMSPVYSQQATLISMPSAVVYPADDQTQTTYVANSFQAIAFPIENTRIIKVIFEDWSGRGATIVIRDKKSGQILIKDFITTKQYMGKFDLSSVPDGFYALEITALSKKDFSNQKYVQNFKLQSDIQRSLSAWDSALIKRLYKRRNYQVGK